MANILIVNTKGGVGKSFISTQILPLAFFKDEKNINIFEVDNNNNTNILTNVIQFYNLNVNSIDNILFDIDVEQDNNVNIIDAGGGDDTKNVIKSLAEAGVEIDFFLIPVTKDYEVTKNLLDTIALIKENFKNPEILIALNRANKAEKDEFIYFWGNEELGVEGVVDKLDKDVKIIFLKDYSELDVVKNLYKTTSLDLLLQNKEVLEKEKEFRKVWHKEAKEKFENIDEQRNYYKQKMQKLFLLKRLKNIQENLQKIFENVI